MSTMDANTFVQQIASDLPASERADLIYYIDNAVNNLQSSKTQMPDAPSVLGQFGSGNSDDVDLFFLLKDQKDTNFTNKIEQFFEEMVQNVLREEERRKIDINFITVKHGEVNWSNKGNEAEINNAIYHTFKLHTFNYDLGSKEYRECPVNCIIDSDVGIKAIKSVRSLLTIISRTTHKRMSKMSVFNKSLKARVSNLQDAMNSTGIFTAVEDGLGKNQSDASLMKDVAFSFIQLDAMMNDKVIPYSKNAIFNTEHQQLLPFIFEMVEFDNAYSYLIPKLDELISNCLDQIQERIIMDEDGVIKFEGDNYAYDIKKETLTVC